MENIDDYRNDQLGKDESCKNPEFVIDFCEVQKFDEKFEEVIAQMEIFWEVN